MKIKGFTSFINVIFMVKLILKDPVVRISTAFGDQYVMMDQLITILGLHKPWNFITFKPTGYETDPLIGHATWHELNYVSGLHCQEGSARPLSDHDCLLCSPKRSSHTAQVESYYQKQRLHSIKVRNLKKRTKPQTKKMTAGLERIGKRKQRKSVRKNHGMKQQKKLTSP